MASHLGMTTTTQPGQVSAAAFGLAAFAVLSWGITPALTAFQVSEIPALQAGLMRSVLAVPAAVAFIFFLRLRLPADKATWSWLLLAGFAAFCGFPILFTLGVSRTATSHAALILACMPVVSGAMAAMLDRRMPRRGWFAGATLAMAGETILITSRDSTGVATLGGDLLCIAAAVISGSGYVAGSRATAKIGTWSTTFWGVAIAGLAQVPLLIWLSHDFAWGGLTYVGWGSTLYLVMFATVLAYAAWYWALNHGSVVRIAPVQFAQPVVSLVFAVLLLSEAITLPIVFSTALILGGIVLASRAQRVPAAVKERN
ncbi:DMT family transporter [Thalassospiraceae bacterium LMO-JJ14]|nr:DMT family transporter [Thalassospiraceae bacterium LMO-JJ14]